MQIAAILTTVAYLTTPALAAFTTLRGYPLPQGGICNFYTFCGGGTQTAGFPQERTCVQVGIGAAPEKGNPGTPVPCNADNGEAGVSVYVKF
ncbi:hypothetical protein HYFRA_00003598 [Hymenoscyphus fraxineus]|uniref:Uncharacterized protein n=1 Tax=Hymenoscyphus fraxineus TaxID=746836 RepID=A0A9N9L124_9HELO|nr:hypothetical protein HYFRA_00003598 [Hymenoscyphus fraxineus]